MNKKFMKLLSVLLIVVTLVSVSVSVFAADNTKITDIKFDNVADNMKGSITQENQNKITGVGSSIVGILQTIGIVLSIIILIVLGLKYMMGSAEEKAEYKKTMIPYVVGAILIFAASALAGVIVNFAQGIASNG